jgi:hypothetical protein
MTLFDFLKPKSAEKRQREKFERVRSETIIKEQPSQMNDFILMSDHDNSLLDENPNGIGRFGLDKTNPIPVNGLDNLDAYMDKIRYKYVSEKNGNTTYNPIVFMRTIENDNQMIGDPKADDELLASSLNVDNIKGIIDVYNLYSIGNKLLVKIYINSYSLKTSNKIPEGFFHRDKIPATQDAKVLMAVMLKQ